MQNAGDKYHGTSSGAGRNSTTGNAGLQHAQEVFYIQGEREEPKDAVAPAVRRPALIRPPDTFQNRIPSVSQKPCPVHAVREPQTVDRYFEINE